MGYTTETYDEGTHATKGKGQLAGLPTCKHRNLSQTVPKHEGMLKEGGGVRSWFGAPVLG
eukprot:1161174-Pelagomonas_calceolata.AAC.9